MNADVTGWEQLLVRWYYVMGPLPRRGLTYILIVMGEFLLLSMLDNLVFHDPGLVDGAEAECNFLTDPQDEWDDHSEAYMWIRVKPTD